MQVVGTADTLYGSEGWGFESLRARPGPRPLPIKEGAFLLTRMPLRIAGGLDVGLLRMPGVVQAYPPQARPFGQPPELVGVPLRVDRRAQLVNDDVLTAPVPAEVGQPSLICGKTSSSRSRC
jgi:hypothetical protein